MRGLIAGLALAVLCVGVAGAQERVDLRVVLEAFDRVDVHRFAEVTGLMVQVTRPRGWRT